MIIKKLTVRDSHSNTRIAPVSFERLNVLVGVSGAGKTTILSSLSKLISLAEGEKRRGLRWELTFEDDERNIINWSGQLSNSYVVTNEGTHASKFIWERLFINENLIINRSEKETIFDGISLPRLDDNLSLLYIFKESEQLKLVHKSLISPVFIDVDSHIFSDTSTLELLEPNIYEHVNSMSKKDFDIVKLSCQFKDLSAREKLYYAFKYDKSAFEQFSFIFKGIFPNVKKVQPHAFTSRMHPEESSRAIVISLEMDDGATVSQNNISSGMFKTMLLLGELCFGNKKSPIIIDEIENSLGVNCLPDVLSELEIAENQVFLTSHHPRVINVISTKHWKIVTRDEEGMVVTYPASEVLDINSSHDQFMQLINSSMYNG